MDDDYSPVDSTDEDEQRKLAAQYPPVDPSAPPAGTADLEAHADQPKTYAPVTPRAPEMGSTEDLEAKADQPKQFGQYAPVQPQSQRPSWKDYAPPDKHGWGRVSQVLGDLFTGEPQKEAARAEQNYKNATSDYDTQQDQQMQQEKAQSSEALQGAQTKEATARANPQPKVGVTGDEETLHDLMTGDNGRPRIDPKTQKPYVYLDAYSAVKQAGNVKPEGQEQNKLGFQGVVAKLDAAGLPSDPKSIDKSLDTALKQGKITPEEHAQARSYQAANPTPGTNLSVHIAGQDEANKNAIGKMFEGSDVLAHMPDGRRVLMSYDDAKSQGIPPERLVKMSAKESQDARDKQASTGATFKSLDNYRTDFKNTAPKLTEDDRRALQVLTSHQQVSQGFLEKAAAGTLDTLFGEPLTGYSDKAMSGIMTKDQFDKLSPDGKKLVSDYFTAIIANFANMKNIMGSVGRNPMQLQAEINTIPMPYLDWQSANAQFENKRGDIRNRASSQPEIYTPPNK